MTQDQQEMSVADRSAEFVPVEGGGEGSSAGTLLTSAYILMWLAVFAFVWLTSKRLTAMQRRVDDLEGALKKADDGARSS